MTMSFDFEDGPPDGMPSDALDKAIKDGRAAPGTMPGGMIRTQTEYQTAITVTKPRVLKEVETRVLDEAARMGTDFIYQWRVKTKDKRLDEGDGKTTIEGLSIDGAMVLARNWGNCALPVRMDQETETHFLIRADFIDLETGFSFPRLYRQRKSGGPGGNMEKDRAEDMAFQIGQSKAQRNVVDKSIPFWLRDRAIQAAKSAAAEKYKDVKAWAPRVLGAFLKNCGVDEARVVSRLRKPVAQWTPYDILTLDVIYRMIKDGETTAAEEFGLEGERPAASDLEEKLRKGPAPAANEEKPAEQTPPARDFHAEAAELKKAIADAASGTKAQKDAVRARFEVFRAAAPAEVVDDVMRFYATVQGEKKKAPREPGEEG